MKPPNSKEPLYPTIYDIDVEKGEDMLCIIYVFKTGKLIASEGHAGEVEKTEELDIPDVKGLFFEQLRGDIWLYKDRVKILTDMDTIDDFKKWLKL